MMAPNEPLTTSILAIMYFGDVVFAISGALTAARYRMDVLGFMMIGTITGIGGGTTRDLLLGRTVWWTQDPLELILCVAASLATFFWITSDHPAQGNDLVRRPGPGRLRGGGLSHCARVRGALHDRGVHGHGDGNRRHFLCGLRPSFSVFEWDRRVSSSAWVKLTTIHINRRSRKRKRK
jgi:hypothetical protein